MSHNRIQKGIILITCMIFLCVFSTLAIALATISGSNLQMAENQRKANRTRACAESGLEIVRFWLNQVSISGTTPETQRFNQIAASFQSAAYAASGISPTYDPGTMTITIPQITLDTEEGKTFSATIRFINSETIQVDITGQVDSLTKTIRANYIYGTRANTVFDFGVATKGPLSLVGNIELEGVNISVESSVYIESENSNLALSIIGNSQIAGDVSISNPLATVLLQGGQAGIGGETGQDAIDNHVSFDVPPTEFPEPNPDYFKEIVTLTPLDPDTYGGETTFENIIIPPNTNPSFASGITLNGLVFVETPNTVTFTGNTNITGLIVGDGDLNDNSMTNQITFLGNVNSSAVSELPGGSQFDPLRDQTGTFLMAPGFGVSFGGNFETLNGAIAANGIEFFGNAGGIINGSVINYSEEEMALSGNSDLSFNRSGLTQMPAGFVPEIVLYYDPASYSEGPF